MSDVEMILWRCREAYLECSSYNDEGTVSVEGRILCSFSTAFLRPDRFSLEVNGAAPGQGARGRAVIWSVDGRYCLWSTDASKIRRYDLVLSALAASYVVGDIEAIDAVPCQLLGEHGLSDLLSRPEMLGLQGTEDLEGRSCFLLTEESRGQPRKEGSCLWIDSRTFLVRRIVRTDEMDREEILRMLRRHTRRRWRVLRRSARLEELHRRILDAVREEPTSMVTTTVYKPVLDRVMSDERFRFHAPGRPHVSRWR